MENSPMSNWSFIRRRRVATVFMPKPLRLKPNIGDNTTLSQSYPQIVPESAYAVKLFMIIFWLE
jgi:hypothetical protein